MWRKTQNKSLVFPLSPQTMLIKGQQTVLKEDLFFPLKIKNNVKMKKKRKVGLVVYYINPTTTPQKQQRKKKRVKRQCKK